MQLKTWLYDFHVHDALRVEYRVTAGANFAPDCAAIERETRSAGGNGVVMALALAKWGARVLLTGNPIGDDAHGRFLLQELQTVPNLGFEPSIHSGLETPYAILLRTDLLRTETSGVATFLSPRASHLQLGNRAKNEDAQHFLGATDPDLEGASQNHAALVESLHRAAQFFSEWAGMSHDFASAETQIYRDGFDGPLSILSREETEAIARAKR